MIFVELFRAKLTETGWEDVKVTLGVFLIEFGAKHLLEN